MGAFAVVLLWREPAALVHQSLKGPGVGIALGAAAV